MKNVAMRKWRIDECQGLSATPGQATKENHKSSFIS
jgi:hypothetical protein